MIVEIGTLLDLNYIESFKNFTLVKQSHAKFHRKRNKNAPEELYSVAGETQKTAHCTAIFVTFVTLYIITSSQIKYECMLIAGELQNCFVEIG